eukprot:1194279-Amphidinium_carterae.1
MRSVAPSRPWQPRWLGCLVRPGSRALLGEPADWVSWFWGTFLRPAKPLPQLYLTSQEAEAGWAALYSASHRLNCCAENESE